MQQEFCLFVTSQAAHVHDAQNACTLIAVLDCRVPAHVQFCFILVQQRTLLPSWRECPTSEANQEQSCAYAGTLEELGDLATYAGYQLQVWGRQGGAAVSHLATQGAVQ